MLLRIIKALAIILLFVGLILLALSSRITDSELGENTVTIAFIAFCTATVIIQTIEYFTKGRKIFLLLILYWLWFFALMLTGFPGILVWSGIIVWTALIVWTVLPSLKSAALHLAKSYREILNKEKIS